MHHLSSLHCPTYTMNQQLASSMYSVPSSIPFDSLLEDEFPDTDYFNSLCPDVSNNNANTHIQCHDDDCDSTIPPFAMNLLPSNFDLQSAGMSLVLESQQHQYETQLQHPQPIQHQRSAIFQHPQQFPATEKKFNELAMSNSNLIESPISANPAPFSIPGYNYYSLTSNPSAEPLVSDTELSDASSRSTSIFSARSSISKDDFGNVMIPVQACQPPCEPRQFSLSSECSAATPVVSNIVPVRQQQSQSSMVILSSPCSTDDEHDHDHPHSHPHSPHPIVRPSSASSQSSTSSRSSSVSGSSKMKGKFQAKQCSICGKYITRDITRHIRTHDIQSRFKCIFPPRQCLHKTKQFNRPYDFKKHLLNSHFEFDNCEVKKFHNLNDKLPCFGTCKCGLRLTGKDWLEHVLAMDGDGKNIECEYLRKYYKESSTRPPVQKFITR